MYITLLYNNITYNSEIPSSKTIDYIIELSSQIFSIPKQNVQIYHNSENLSSKNKSILQNLFHNNSTITLNIKQSNPTPNLIKPFKDLLTEMVRTLQHNYNSFMKNALNINDKLDQLYITCSDLEKIKQKQKQFQTKVISTFKQACDLFNENFFKEIDSFLKQHSSSKSKVVNSIPKQENTLPNSKSTILLNSKTKCLTTNNSSTSKSKPGFYNKISFKNNKVIKLNTKLEEDYQKENELKMKHNISRNNDNKQIQKHQTTNDKNDIPLLSELNWSRCCSPKTKGRNAVSLDKNENDLNPYDKDNKPEPTTQEESSTCNSNTGRNNNGNINLPILRYNTKHLKRLSKNLILFNEGNEINLINANYDKMEGNTFSSNTSKLSFLSKGSKVIKSKNEFKNKFDFII